MVKILSGQTETTYSMTKNPKPDMTRDDGAVATSIDERDIKVAAMTFLSHQSLSLPSFMKEVAMELASAIKNPTENGYPRKTGMRALRSYPRFSSSTHLALSISTKTRMAFLPPAISSRTAGVSSS
jgi:hypothetical protein